MAITNNGNGTLTGGTDTLVTGNALNTVIPGGSLKITNKTTGTVGALQVILDVGASSKDLFNQTLNPGASWINDGPIMLKTSADTIQAVGTAATFDWTVSFLDDYLA
jgi:hypothetical protein